MGQPLKAEPLDEPAQPKGRKVALPVRLTPAQHDALRHVAFERRISLHALILEGVAEVLRQHGK